MDIVYALGSGSRWHNNELRFSLRSLQKYYSNLGKVFIVGEKPDWTQNIIHIPFDDSDNLTADGNIIKKILRACEEKELSTRFLFGSDDQVILKPMITQDFKPYHDGLIQNKKPEWLNAKKLWRKRFKRTYDDLVENGFTTYSYDTHIITPFNKNTFKKIMSGLDKCFDEYGITINTTYLNRCNIKRIHIEDRKATVYKYKSYRELKKLLKGKQYLGYNDAGLNRDLIFFFYTTFPEVSRYEKYDIDKAEKNKLIYNMKQNKLKIFFKKLPLRFEI